MRRTRLKPVAGLVLTMAASGARAQSIQGSILGVVRDASGAVISDATVLITDTDTAVRTSLTTDAAGNYQALDLTADHYTVQVSAPGFRTVTLSGLTLTARQQLRADVGLTVGSVGQEVTVNSADAGVIATDTPSIDASLPAVEVQDLPANYRASQSGTSPLSIIQVLPGVQADNNGNLSVQGGLPFQTEVSVDGVTVQSSTSNSPLPDAFPSGDSIAEIRVDGVLNNAEFGQPGEVTTITRSGTNNLHGALFYYHQDSGEQAKPFGAVGKPKLVTNDFGASAGGPVVIPKLFNGRDHTFVFGTYEGYRSPRTGVVQYSVPTAAMKQGNFSGVQGVKPLKNPFTGGTYANYTVPTNTSSAAFLALFPDPNYGADLTSYVPGATNYSTNKNTSLFSNQFDLRGDQYLGTKALLFARFTWKNIDQSAPSALLVPDGSNISQNRVVVAAFNYNFSPHLLNELRFGATLNSSGATNPFNGPGFVQSTQLQGLQNLYYNGVPELDFNFLSSLNADRVSSITKSRTFQYTDSVSWVKGQHSFKFGVDLRQIEAITPLGFNGADNYGTFDFTSAAFTGQEFADFLIGAPNQTFYDVVQSDNDGKTLHYHLYAQDQWKATNHLTLSYGLRYELHPAYHDPSGNIGNFDPSIAKSGRVVYPDGKQSLLSLPFLASFNSCGIGQSSGAPAQNGAACTPTVGNSQAGLPSGLRTTVKDRFMPRIGFAYRLGDDRTTLRGGFGMYNITLLGSSFYSLTGTLQADTVAYTNLETAGGPAFVWPQIFAGAGSAGATPTFGQAYFGTANDTHWRDPYSEQTSLSIDRDLGSGFGARLSYIGLVTHHLVWAPNLNDLPYSTTVSAYNQPLSARPFPNWGRINTRSTGADANYQSLQIDVAHHQSKGLTFDSTYTLAKNVSDNQGPGSSTQSFAGENGGNRASYAGTPRIDFGQVYGTRRNRWITTAVYQLPLGRGRAFGGGMPHALDLLVGGWQTSNIFLWQSGPFLTPYFPSGQGDPSGTGSGLNGGLYGDLGHRAQNPDRVANPVPRGQSRNGWINTAAYTCPGSPAWTPGSPCTTGSGQLGAPLPIGRFGNAQDGSLVGPGTIALSSGLSKSFALTERVSLRAEGTFTNVLNHTNLATPNLNVASGQFGVITTTQTGDFAGPRTGQISARLQF